MNNITFYILLFVINIGLIATDFLIKKNLSIYELRAKERKPNIKLYSMYAVTIASSIFYWITFGLLYLMIFIFKDANFTLLQKQLMLLTGATLGYMCINVCYYDLKLYVVNRFLSRFAILINTISGIIFSLNLPSHDKWVGILSISFMFFLALFTLLFKNPNSHAIGSADLRSIMLGYPIIFIFAQVFAPLLYTSILLAVIFIQVAIMFKKQGRFVMKQQESIPIAPFLVVPCYIAIILLPLTFASRF